ncbi:MAG: hypothetical protein IT374_15280, partial [Polyangiaceae bacterium]|nr:hypothetical protein [Polyangiaceae bacterium]
DDEEESDADDEEESDADDDDVIATTVADFAEDDLRRTTYEELVEALRAPAGERDERMVAALGSVCELVEGLAQSTIEWLGTFEELRTASDPVTRRLRRGFRERQAELAEEEGGQDPRTPDAPSDGPIADEELPALHEWLATQGLAEC